MLMFEDSTAAIDEPKNERLEARTQRSVKQTIRRAATICGVELTSFVVSAAYRAAQEAIEAQKITMLNRDADQAVFFSALENPPQPNERLRKAFALRKNLIANAD
ncbi:MAG: DUF1778 domain-containing protein [Rhodobacteraceae bacterium]|nr:DUF1778 domain-containing protein [Paracoccaceae bacterium]